MPFDCGEGRPSRVAVIGYTRPYRSDEIVPALMESGFHILERACDGNLARVAARVSPDVIVLAIHPSQDADRALVGDVSSAVDSAIVVVGPGRQHTGFQQTLEAGADACVSEASGAGQLLAQVEALVRRERKRSIPAAGEESLSVGALLVDFRRRAVWFEGTHIPMSPMEFKILSLLVQHAGKVLSPVEIVAAVHEYPYTAQQARDTVKVYVRRLRQKLESVRPGANYIFNTRGFGYILDPEAVGHRPPQAERAHPRQLASAGIHTERHRRVAR
ncbi:MAG: winged helix-turn-helix transcriptional regulator [Hyphomicrobiales bacterium]